MQVLAIVPSPIGKLRLLYQAFVMGSVDFMRYLPWGIDWNWQKMLIFLESRGRGTW